MDERRAEQQGLRFMGAYSRDVEEMKERAAGLRQQGFRAVVVTSRGNRSTGYSVYTEERYFKMRELQDMPRRILTAEMDVVAARKKVQELEDKVRDLQRQHQALAAEMGKPL